MSGDPNSLDDRVKVVLGILESVDCAVPDDTYLDYLIEGLCSSLFANDQEETSSGRLSWAGSGIDEFITNNAFWPQRPPSSPDFGRQSPEEKLGCSVFALKLLSEAVSRASGQTSGQSSLVKARAVEVLSRLLREGPGDGKCRPNLYALRLARTFLMNRVSVVGGETVDPDRIWTGFVRGDLFNAKPDNIYRTRELCHLASDLLLMDHNQSFFKDVLEALKGPMNDPRVNLAKDILAAAVRTKQAGNAPEDEDATWLRELLRGTDLGKMDVLIVVRLILIWGGKTSLESLASELLRRRLCSCPGERHFQGLCPLWFRALKEAIEYGKGNSTEVDGGNQPLRTLLETACWKPMDTFIKDALDETAQGWTQESRMATTWLAKELSKIKSIPLVGDPLDQRLRRLVVASVVKEDLDLALTFTRAMKGLECQGLLDMDTFDSLAKMSRSPELEVHDKCEVLQLILKRIQSNHIHPDRESLPVGKVMEDLWCHSWPSADWRLKDALLSILAAIHSQGSEPSKDTADCLERFILDSVGHQNSFVRAAAFNLAASCPAMTSRPHITREAIEAVHYDPEAIVRRSALLTVRQSLISNRRDHLLSQPDDVNSDLQGDLLEGTLISALLDFDWEVKEVALSYWETEAARASAVPCPGGATTSPDPRRGSRTWEEALDIVIHDGDGLLHRKALGFLKAVSSSFGQEEGRRRSLVMSHVCSKVAKSSRSQGEAGHGRCRGRSSDPPQTQGPTADADLRERVIDELLEEERVELIRRGFRGPGSRGERMGNEFKRTVECRDCLLKDAFGLLETLSSNDGGACLYCCDLDSVLEDIKQSVGELCEIGEADCF